MTSIKKPNKIGLNLQFEKIFGSPSQTIILYNLLSIRGHNISHTLMPTMNQHKRFVKNNPYRVWYLIKYGNIYVGSTYILSNNCIGIFLSNNYESKLPVVLKFLMTKYKPLKGKDSIRPSNFYMNISPTNIKFHAQMKKINGKLCQLSYLLDSKFITL